MAQHKSNLSKNSDIINKVVLITGGAKRIGACLVKTLHAAGMNIVIHYHTSAKPARELQKKLNHQREHSCSVIQGDLGEFHKLASLIEEAVEQMGRLDVLINNASAFFPTPLASSNEQDWDTLIDINLKAPFFLTQAAAPHLTHHQGSIINIIDIYAQRPLTGYPIYCASKAGLASLTRSFAQSLAPVRVNGISPGAILWPEHQHDEAAQRQLLSRTPLKRPGDPQDIAQTALFLIQSASYVTGQIISIDGGRSVTP